VRAATPAGQTCSAGVATWDGRESEQSLVARAHRALYEAKARARDRTIADAGGGPSAAAGGLLAERTPPSRWGPGTPGTPYRCRVVSGGGRT
jgi:hypothetical protein